MVCVPDVTVTDADFGEPALTYGNTRGFVTPVSPSVPDHE
jgi:hypothetical protein